MPICKERKSPELRIEQGIFMQSFEPSDLGLFFAALSLDRHTRNHIDNLCGHLFHCM